VIGLADSLQFLIFACQPARGIDTVVIQLWSGIF
jgi:hypothetical protein